jgi:hypothetical protein
MTFENVVDKKSWYAEVCLRVKQHSDILAHLKEVNSPYLEGLKAESYDNIINLNTVKSMYEFSPECAICYRDPDGVLGVSIMPDKKDADRVYREHNDRAYRDVV